MNKQTKTIVIIVLAVVVIGGLYFGVNRWRQQRLANQILEQAYGLNSDLLGNVTGGVISDKVAREIAQEMAKEELAEQEEEAKEAAKTPRDHFSETVEMETYDDESAAIVSDARDIVEEVFGDNKVTSISAGAWYGGASTGSGYVEFKIARLTTGADLGKLNKVLTDKGFPIIQSGIDGTSAGVTAGNDVLSYIISFEVGEQTVSVMIVNLGE